MRGIVAVQVVALLLCAVNGFAQVGEDEESPVDVDPLVAPQRHVVLDPAAEPPQQGLWSTLSMFEAFDNHALAMSTAGQTSPATASGRMVPRMSTQPSRTPGAAISPIVARLRPLAGPRSATIHRSVR